MKKIEPAIAAATNLLDRFNGHGRAVKLSVTAGGSIVSRATLSGGTPHNVCVTENGDVAVFPQPGDPDFDPAAHDPIGLSPLELLKQHAACLAKRDRA